MTANSVSAPVQPGPRPQLYVISVTGDGGQTTIVPEDKLKQALHEAYCSCGKDWQKCSDEVITNTIAKLDDPEEWTQNYPTYERHIWLDHGEDYTVQVMRVSSAFFPVAAPSADMEQLQKVFDYFMGPQASGSFTCSCNKPEVCGICELREETKSVLESLRRRVPAQTGCTENWRCGQCGAYFNTKPSGCYLCDAGPEQFEFAPVAPATVPATPEPMIKTVLDEKALIPSGPLAVNHALNFKQDWGIRYEATGLPLIRVACNPSVGQYRVDTATGLYHFSENEIGAQILISYTFRATTQGTPERTVNLDCPKCTTPIGWNPERGWFHMNESSCNGVRNIPQKGEEGK